MPRGGQTNILNPPLGGRKDRFMRMPLIWDGITWRNATKYEYENIIINVPVYGKANYIVPTVWNLPIVDTDLMTGSKVVDCGRSIQFRFSCSKTTDTAKAVRAYKLGLDKDSRAGVRFNYTKSGSCFVFETTFCGSLSGLKKFESFINKLSSMTSIKSILVRMRQEDTQEVSVFKRLEYSENFLNVVGYLRDTFDIKAYNNLNIKKMKVVPGKKPYGIKVIL